MSTVPQPVREDTHLIVATIWDPQTGRPVDLGTFDTLGGGEGDSEEGKYRPGGMAPEFSIGGVKTIGNLTIGRYLDRARDWPMLPWLYARVGAARMSVSVTPLDFAGARAGAPVTWQGTLKQVTMPDLDSTASDAAIMELEMLCDGEVV